MYSMQYTNVAKQQQLSLRFNSIGAALKFMKETLNDKDVQQYIGHLRNRKKLDALNFAQSERQLYPLYGDLDKPFPVMSDVASEIIFDSGVYEYRLGSSDPTFYEGFGRISFRIQNIRQSVESSQSGQLNNWNTQARQVVSNEYGRAYHE